MITISILSIAFISLLLGKRIFTKWINPLSIYVFIWTGMLSLYQMKLINYIDLSTETWFLIGGAYFSFFIGVLTLYVSRKLFYKEFYEPKIDTSKSIFVNDCKYLKIVIFISICIGFFSGLEHWNYLFNKYGSIVNIFLNGNEIYAMRIKGGFPGVTPYLSAVSFVGVFFSGVMVAYRNKLSVLSILPIIAVVIQQLAFFSRAGILFAFMLFSFTLIFMRGAEVFKKEHLAGFKKYKMVISISVLLLLAVFSAGLVRSTRGSTESFSGAGRGLSSFRDNYFLTPSLYLYLSGHVGALDKYIEKNSDDEPLYGKMTFQPIANIISKFGVIEKPPTYISLYKIPVWINTSSYIRILYMDFKIYGVLIIPYILGLLITFYWVKFYETLKLNYLAILVYLCVVVAFTFLTMFTRQGNWFISFILAIIISLFIEKITKKLS